MQVPVKSDGSERVIYNNPEVPYYIHSSYLSSYDGFSAISHWHDDLEFIYIINGHMWYHINEDIVLLEEGNGIFVNSCQLHYGFSKDLSECHFVCILFHPEILSANRYIEDHYISPMIHDGAYPYVILKSEIPWHRKTLDKIKQAAGLEHLQNPALLMQLSALSIYIDLQTNLPPTDTKSLIPDQTRLLLKRMIRYIQEHYTEKITLKQIADSAGISKSQCGLLFQKHTGTSPIEYLTEYRLQQARTILKNTDKTMIETALESGFSGSSYFCETFKRKYGITPLQYRKSLSVYPI